MVSQTTILLEQSITSAKDVNGAVYFSCKITGKHTDRCYKSLELPSQFKIQDMKYIIWNSKYVFRKMLRTFSGNANNGIRNK